MTLFLENSLRIFNQMQTRPFTKTFVQLSKSIKPKSSYQMNNTNLRFVSYKGNGLLLRQILYRHNFSVIEEVLHLRFSIFLWVAVLLSQQPFDFGLHLSWHLGLPMFLNKIKNHDKILLKIISLDFGSLCITPRPKSDWIIAQTPDADANLLFF